MSLITFSAISEATLVQRELHTPLIVLVHSSSDEEKEKDAVLMRDLELHNENFCFSRLKGRIMQLKALSTILSIGCLDHLVLVHTVQEGSEEYQQLLQAAPAYMEVPRVHLLAPYSMGFTPTVLSGENFTSTKLLRNIQRFLRVPLSSAAPSVPTVSQPTPSPSRSGKKILTRTLQLQEEINEDLEKRSRSTVRSLSFGSLCPPTATTTTSLTASASVLAQPSPASNSASATTLRTGEQISSPNAATPIPTETPATTTSLPASVSSSSSAVESETTVSHTGELNTDLNTKKRQSTSPLPTAVPPPTQRKKPDVIHIRCIVPSGKTFTTENLSPSSSTIFTHVRPVVREHLQHDHFSFIAVKTGMQGPQRLTLEEEQCTLESISVTTPSTLRVVISSDAPNSSPRIPAKVGAFLRSKGNAVSSSGASVLHQLFSRGKNGSQESGNNMPSGEHSLGEIGKKEVNFPQEKTLKSPSSSLPSPSGAPTEKKFPSYRYTPQSNIRTLTDVLEASKREEEISQGRRSRIFDPNGSGEDNAVGNAGNDKFLSMTSLLNKLKNRGETQMHSSREKPPSEILNRLHEELLRSQGNISPSGEDTSDEDDEKGEKSEFSGEDGMIGAINGQRGTTNRNGVRKGKPFSGEGRRLRDSNENPSSQPAK